MSIELREGRFVKSLFYTELKILGPDVGNLMGWLYKDPGEDEWHFEYRFRYYEDDHNGITQKSKDRKAWIHVAGPDTAEMIELIKQVFEKVGAGSFEHVIIESASVKGQMKRLSEQPWTNMKGPMTREEHDAWKREK